MPLALSIAPGTRSRTHIFDGCAERAQVHFASVGDVQAGYGVLDGLSQGSGHEQAWTSSHDCELGAYVFRQLSPFISITCHGVLFDASMLTAVIETGLVFSTRASVPSGNCSVA